MLLWHQVIIIIALVIFKCISSSCGFVSAHQQESIIRRLHHDDIFADSSSDENEVPVIVQGDSDRHDDHHDHDHHSHKHDGGHSCGTLPLSLQQEKIEKLRTDAFRTHSGGGGGGANNNNDDDKNRRLLPTSCDELCDQCIPIQVTLNLLVFETNVGPIVPHPTPTAASLLDGLPFFRDAFSSFDVIAQMFDENMAVLNEAFVGTPFAFEWDGNYTVGVSTGVTKNAFPNGPEISRILGNGDIRVMDVFVAYNVLNSNSNGNGGGDDHGGETLGIAILPGAQADGAGDGIYIRYDVLPDGGFPDNDSGYTLVHEAGHWLGLMHTFQTYTVTSNEYDCDPSEIGLGDFVEDTPLQRGSSEDIDCRIFIVDETLPLPNTCPDLPGLDPLFNYMNYLNADFCYEARGEFTCGQAERMYTQWTLFREHVTSCTDPDHMEIELVIDFDHNRVNEGNLTRIILFNEGGESIYDSLRDQEYALFLVDGVILIDLCTPRSRAYSVEVTDKDGNGFDGGGSIQIFIDRVLIDTISGDFGNRTVVEIAPSTTAAPTGPRVPAESSDTPSIAPSNRPTPSIDASQTTNSPSASSSPTSMPSAIASAIPTYNPSSLPSALPTAMPSNLPSAPPTVSESDAPSSLPSTVPSASPSISPSVVPSQTSTTVPTSEIVQRGDEDEDESSAFMRTTCGGATLVTFLVISWLVKW